MTPRIHSDAWGDFLRKTRGVESALCFVALEVIAKILISSKRNKEVFYGNHPKRPRYRKVQRNKEVFSENRSQPPRYHKVQRDVIF